MRIANTITETRAFLRMGRDGGDGVGLVPTMGALHEGHLALMRRARSDNDVVVMSLFVNPTQFGPGEDFAAYPRNFNGDARLAQAEGVDLIFAPGPEEMYPGRPATTVRVERLTQGLCGRFRPGHFDGVATVCCKLFNIVRPHRAYFGEKDYQQVQVIRQMVADLNLPLTVVPVATVRESDGLALSSRNAYLGPEDRAVAPRLYQALQAAAEAVRGGAGGTEAEGAVAAHLAQEPRFRLQYCEAVHPETLERVGGGGPPLVIAAAVFLGATRLIDNVKVEAL